MDELVDPAHRRRWLHSKIKSAILKEMESDVYHFEVAMRANDLTTGNNLKTRASVSELKSMYWHREQSAGVLSRVYWSLRRYIAYKQTSRDLFQPFHILDSNYNCTDHFSRSGIVLDDKPWPDAMAMLASRQDRDCLISLVRDERYDSWRFRNPRTTCRFLFFKKRLFGRFYCIGATLAWQC